MTIEELIEKLEEIKKREGNIEVVVQLRGGFYAKFPQYDSVSPEVQTDVEDTDGSEYNKAVVL